MRSEIWAWVKKLDRNTAIVCLILYVPITCLFVGCSALDQSYVAANYEASQVFGAFMIKEIEADTNLQEKYKKIQLDAIREWMSLNEYVYKKTREE